VLCLECLADSERLQVEVTYKFKTKPFTELAGCVDRAPQIRVYLALDHHHPDRGTDLIAS
jgi:hypothetical protein